MSLALLAMAGTAAGGCGGDDDGQPAAGHGGVGGHAGGGGAGAGRGGSSGTGDSGGSSHAGESGASPGTGGDAQIAGASGNGGKGGSGGSGTNGGSGALGGAGAIGGTSGADAQGGGAGQSDGGAGMGGEAGTGSGCFKVSPSGDDLAAAASLGAVPFASVDVALAFADTHRDLGTDVCVAAGASCGASATFAGPAAGDLAMPNGISLFGRYESTGWTRCNDSTTSLAPATQHGVYFGATVQSATTLDGFRVLQASGSSSAGISVEGAQRVTLSSIELVRPLDTSTSGEVVGLDVTDASVTVDGIITSGAPPTPSSASVFGVRARRSELRLSNGTLSVGHPDGNAYGIWLEASPASRIHDCTVDDPQGDAEVTIAAGTHVGGDAQDVEILGGSFRGKVGLELAPCAGSAPSIEEAEAVGKVGIEATGDCHPHVEACVVRGTATGIHCASASSCAISNSDIGLDGASGHYAVLCEEGSCANISHNSIYSHHGSTYAFLDRYGVMLAASSPLIDGNSITLGCSAGYGVSANHSASRIVNNDILCREHCEFAGPAVPPPQGFGIWANDSDLDIHSNLIDGGGDDFTLCDSIALTLSTGTEGSSVRNNIFSPGVFCGPNRISVLPSSIYEHNLEVVWGAQPSVPDAQGNFEGDAWFAHIDGTPRDPHLTAASPAIDSGTTTGAPASDRDGNPRSSRPDLGPYEWGDLPALCAAVTCSGHGSCIQLGPTAWCECASGYANPSGNALACADIDECATDNGDCDPHTVCHNLPGSSECGPCPPGYSGDGETGCLLDECATDNGGCDPLTTCTDTPGGRTCGPCPPGYDGDGETGCVFVDVCNPNPCQNGGACHALGGGHTCTCPTGINGNNCEIVFEHLVAGANHLCGLRSDQKLGCWGFDAAGETHPPAATFVDVAAGRAFSCGIKTDGTVVCWGDKSGPGADWSDPTGTFTAIAAFEKEACGIRSAGTVTCWAVLGGWESGWTGTYQELTLGSGYGCGLGTSGVSCFGTSANGVLTPPSGTFAAIDAGEFNGCGRRADGHIECWGSNGNGESTPPAGSFIDVEVGKQLGCAIGTNGTVSCWGSGASGTFAPPAGTFLDITLNDTFACGIKTDHSVTCWGNTFSVSHPPTGQP